MSGPRGLRPEEISTLLDELTQRLIGARLEKVYDRPPHGFLFRFRIPAGDGEGAVRCPILFTTRPGTSRFHIVEEVGDSPKSPSDPAAELRALLGGWRVLSIDQPGGDRVARIRFFRGREESPRETLDLVFEFFGRQGRLLVLDPETKRIRFVHGRGGQKTKDRYRFPEPPPRPSGETWTMPFAPLEHIPEALRDQATPFHRFIELRMRDEEQRLALEERLRTVTTRLRRERKRRRQLLEKLGREVETAARFEEWQRWGDLLKSEQHAMRRGQESIEVTDWFDPATPTITIPLDPTITPTENLERIFRRARKGKKALPNLEERLGRNSDELAELEAWRELLEGADLVALAADLTVLEGAEDWLRAKERSRPPQRGGEGSDRAARRRKGGERAAGKSDRFRRYRTREGLEVLAGRSARDNDELSIRVARGNDLFFHRAGRPGPHVIVRVPKGKQASPESIDDAAFIAAYLAGWRGPGDERVVWTEAKHVRKPKGLAPGQVLTHRTREHRVRYAPERIRTLSAHRAEAQKSGEERGGTDPVAPRSDLQ